MSAGQLALRLVSGQRGLRPAPVEVESGSQSPLLTLDELGQRQRERDRADAGSWANELGSRSLLALFAALFAALLVVGLALLVKLSRAAGRAGWSVRDRGARASGPATADAMPARPTADRPRPPERGDPGGPVPRPPAAAIDARGAPLRTDASDFTPGRILRPARELASRLERTVAAVRTGRFSRAGGRERELVAALRRTPRRCQRIAVVSSEAGVGSTTAALLLAETLATYRGDWIAAVDPHPDAGSLGWRLGPRRTVALGDPPLPVVADAHRGQIRAYADEGGDGGRDWRRDLELLEISHSAIIVDLGTHADTPAGRKIVDLVDRVVVVAGREAASEDAVARVLEELEPAASGEGVVIVPNARRRSDRFRRSAEPRLPARAVTPIRRDRHLEHPTPELDDLEPATRIDGLTLAVALMEEIA